MLRADIKPIVDGEAAHRAASPSMFVLTYLRIAIENLNIDPGVFTNRSDQYSIAQNRSSKQTIGKSSLIASAFMRLV